VLTEKEGSDVLARVFAARGFVLARDVLFDEAGVSFTIDGWDADARVGFEYLTNEAGDHEDLTADEMGRLAMRMERGELYVFLVDETDVADVKELEEAANRFLDEVARRRS
jgi:hypothetical protein